MNRTGATLRTRFHSTTLLLLLALALQLGLAHGLKPITPHRDILPNPPSNRELDAMAFGDRQFLYRQLVLDLQNFGDTGGRSTHMSLYDMDKVVGWLSALDRLDNNANHHLVLATRYFTQTREGDDLKKIVRYLQQHITENPRHAVWLGDAIYLAQARLGDLALALELGDLIDAISPRDVPLAVRQLPAFLRERAGLYAAAAQAMQKVRETWGDIAGPAELVFMEKYVALMMAQELSPPLPGAPRHPDRMPPRPR
jgi:hypothetical protein